MACEGRMTCQSLSLDTLSIADAEWSPRLVASKQTSIVWDHCSIHKSGPTSSLHRHIRPTSPFQQLRSPSRQASPQKWASSTTPFSVSTAIPLRRTSLSVRPDIAMAGTHVSTDDLQRSNFQVPSADSSFPSCCVYVQLSPIP